MHSSANAQISKNNICKHRTKENVNKKFPKTYNSKSEGNMKMQMYLLVAYEFIYALIFNE